MPESKELLFSRMISLNEPDAATLVLAFTSFVDVAIAWLAKFEQALATPFNPDTAPASMPDKMQTLPTSAVRV